MPAGGVRQTAALRATRREGVEVVGSQHLDPLMMPTARWPGRHPPHPRAEVTAPRSGRPARISRNLGTTHFLRCGIRRELRACWSGRMAGRRHLSEEKLIGMSIYRDRAEAAARDGTRIVPALRAPASPDRQDLMIGRAIDSARRIEFRVDARTRAASRDGGWARSASRVIRAERITWDGLSRHRAFIDLAAGWDRLAGSSLMSQNADDIGGSP